MDKRKLPKTPEHKKKISESRKGYVRSAEHQAKINTTKRTTLLGQSNPNWKGGITPLYHLIRESIEMDSWKKEVFIRDNYTCDCGTEGNVNAHHIKPFAHILSEFLQEYSQFSPMEDIETLLRLAVTYKPFWEVSNGKTVCVNCHKHFPRGVRKAKASLFQR